MGNVDNVRAGIYAFDHALHDSGKTVRISEVGDEGYGAWHMIVFDYFQGVRCLFKMQIS